MTLFTLIEGKSDAVMAQTTVLAIGYFKHRKFDRALLDAREYIRMTDLAAIPHDMLFVGEYDIRHPCAPRRNGKILLCI